MVDASIRNIRQLSKRIEEIKEVDAGRLRSEYERLVQGIFIY